MSDYEPAIAKIRHLKVKPPKEKPPRKPMKKWKRKPSEYARIYGSKERVEWIKSLPCLACRVIHKQSLWPTTGMKAENAHTENEGKSRKGHYTTIIPLCPVHHRAFDRWKPPCDEAQMRHLLKSAAPEIERLWQQHKLNAA